MLTVQDAEQVIDDLDALEARLAAHFEMLMVLHGFAKGKHFLSHIFMFCYCLSVNPCQETRSKLITAGGKLKVSFWLEAQRLKSADIQ